MEKLFIGNLLPSEHLSTYCTYEGNQRFAKRLMVPATDLPLKCK